MGLEYAGSRFCGWQRQTGQDSIQGALEHALSQVAAETIQVTVAGRTDAGVHALCQVVHFETRILRSPISWVRGGNRFLPPDISIRWARRVPPEFHARFSATGRKYRYLILNRRERPGLFAGQIAWHPLHLEPVPMQEAAAMLLGTHDFSSFRASGCQARSPVRTLRRLDVWRRGDMVGIEAEANAFLHHMVRNLAGVLMKVGRGERPPEWAAGVLASRDRRCAAVTAPGSGLYFAGALYPEAFCLPACDGTPPEKLFALLA